MLRIVIGVLGAIAVALPTMAQVQRFPASFRIQEVETNGTTLHVRIGGSGSPVGNARTLAACPDRVDRDALARSRIRRGASLCVSPLVGNQSCRRGIDVRTLRISVPHF